MTAPLPAGTHRAVHWLRMQVVAWKSHPSKAVQQNDLLAAETAERWLQGGGEHGKWPKEAAARRESE